MLLCSFLLIFFINHYYLNVFINFFLNYNMNAIKAKTLSCSLLYLQSLEQCLAYSRYLINIC